ncbi:ATPase, T2SS/T4P/T4SS family [Paenibacillus kobensis]|uniref:ATPase, T2SS/T4P/T4SS family n=1 Tax=Paenibacillus kobensis TaxID=59841 RepID=UPI000FD8D6B6|nr:ATPase, T2SS/T4P/T4SS family [Paenibacillus kobensis]
MSGGGQERFSPAVYSSRLRVEAMPVEEAAFPAGKGHEAGESFTRFADEIRAYLAAPRGMNEEERRQYGERLNRAVLGFAKEREHVLALINDWLMRHRIHELPEYSHPYETLAEALFAEVIGLNVLELVLAERSGLEEIQVVGTRIYEVRGGNPVLSRYSFSSVRDVERIQQNLVLYNNDRINPRKRWAEVMLQDGSRVTMTGFGFTAAPTLTIRFYTVQVFRLDALCRPGYETMNASVRSLLLQALQARFNLVIIGPTNSGKTHLMKSLIAELPDEERIVTLENRFEMMIHRDFPGKNAVEYEFDEDDAAHRSAQAFKLALRQSPQRIVHAEIRDQDANIYVRACTRGHEGSMTTVHANTLEDVPEAVSDMCMLDGRSMNPERLVKRIAEYVTQLGIEIRIVNGKRRICRIGEIGWKDGNVTVTDWVRYDEASGDWRHHELPSARAFERFRRYGIEPDWQPDRQPDERAGNASVGTAASSRPSEAAGA